MPAVVITPHDDSAENYPRARRKIDPYDAIVEIGSIRRDYDAIVEKS